MRRVVSLLALLALVLAAPVAAQARPNPTARASSDCWCVTWFANRYVANDGLQTIANMNMFLRGVAQANRTKLRQGIYDWQKHHDFSDSWCKSNAKACKALIACLIAAGGAVAQGVAKREDAASIGVEATGACATAAAAMFALG